MATLTGNRAGEGAPVYGNFTAGSVSAAFGGYTFASAPSQNDIAKLCKVPAGCKIIGGFLAGADLDTGTEALELDVGDTNDADLLLDSDVITGDAITDLLPTYASSALFYRPFNGVLLNGPREVTADDDDETAATIQATVTAAADAGGTGYIWARVDYLVGV